MKALGIVTLLFSVPALAAAADSLLDPTRPPPAWLAAQDRSAKPNEAVEAPKQPVQLVLTGPTRRFAIVRGEIVGSGADVRAPRLVELKRNEVTIETKEGQETLDMFPGIEITPAKPSGGASPKKEKK
jgi:hypothetical protein